MKNSTVLIIDDEPTILASMTAILSHYYRVQALNGPERVVEVAESLPQPDIILLDVMMPNIDGYSVLSQLKMNARTCNIPVIFITANDSLEYEEKGLKLGAVDYITKPIKPLTLLARVKNHLIIKHSTEFVNDKNGYLEKEISRRMAESLAIQDICIRALAHLAETRDNDTGSHILRTQNYVEILAKHLQKKPKFNTLLSDEYCTLLTKSAPLHDIGKVGIPDHILLKPGRLNSNEWTIMQTHVNIGVDAINLAESDVAMSLPFLSTAKEIVRWHHEHWNGKGYPDGLKGESIPLSARLMALADVFDALVSKRVYKEAMTTGEAKAIILAEKGLQFDPDVVDAFEAEFEQFVHIAEKYRSFISANEEKEAISNKQ